MNKPIDNKDIIAKKLRMLRAEHNLTQKDVAGRLNISQQTYSKYENKSANLDSETILKLSELYGVTTDEILCKDKKNSKAGKSRKTVAYSPSEEDIKELVKQVLEEMSDKK